MSPSPTFLQFSFFIVTLLAPMDTTATTLYGKLCDAARFTKTTTGNCTLAAQESEWKAERGGTDEHLKLVAFDGINAAPVTTHDWKTEMLLELPRGLTQEKAIDSFIFQMRNNAASPAADLRGDFAAAAAGVHFCSTRSTLIDPVKLVAFLPKRPEGWKALDPFADTKNESGLTLATASTTYTKGDTKVDVSITNPSDIKKFHEVQDEGLTQIMRETPSADGYMKFVTIEGCRGFQGYRKKDNSGVLLLYVGERFFIKIEGNMEPEALTEWFKRIDLKALVDLK